MVCVHCKIREPSIFPKEQHFPFCYTEPLMNVVTATVASDYDFVSYSSGCKLYSSIKLIKKSEIAATLLIANIFNELADPHLVICNTTTK